LIDFEYFLNERINNNKNLENLASFFTEGELSQLSDKSISIVGTNAKTSTANYIYQVLSELGIKTLLFTSPHLISLLKGFSQTKMKLTILIMLNK